MPWRGDRFFSLLLEQAPQEVWGYFVVSLHFLWAKRCASAACTGALGKQEERKHASFVIIKFRPIYSIVRPPTQESGQVGFLPYFYCRASLMKHFNLHAHSTGGNAQRHGAL